MIEELRRMWEAAHFADLMLLSLVVWALLLGAPVTAMLVVLVLVFAWGARGDLS